MIDVDEVYDAYEWHSIASMSSRLFLRSRISVNTV
jgi:hypothetical protein